MASSRMTHLSNLGKSFRDKHRCNDEEITIRKTFSTHINRLFTLSVTLLHKSGTTKRHHQSVHSNEFYFAAAF